MEIGLKDVLSYIPEQRLVGDRRKYTKVLVTKGTLQASAQPLLLMHCSEHLCSPSLLEAPEFTPEPQGVAELRAAWTQPHQGQGALGTKGKTGHDVLLVWFFWVICKVCPRKPHPSRDDSKVCRQAHRSNSFKSTIFTYHISFSTNQWSGMPKLITLLKIWDRCLCKLYFQ